MSTLSYFSSDSLLRNSLIRVCLFSLWDPDCVFVKTSRV